MMHVPQTVKVRRNSKNNDAALTIPVSYRDIIPESECFLISIKDGSIVYTPIMGV